MRAPDFWRRDGLAASLLAPAAALYDLAGRLRWRVARPATAGVPVICIGNLVAGGAGKTPTALALAELVCEALPGRPPHFLSRGHGGRLKGPHRVDPAADTAADVGDEPLLLAAVAPTWIARDRPVGAAAAVAAGAGLIIMDDGFQNPSLYKDLSFLVIDGGYGLGNGRVMPAGPLRETPTRALARADAVVLIGDDRHGLATRVAPLPVLHGHLAPAAETAARFAGREVLAFAGIGRPEKFFETLAGAGARVVEAHAFPDHWRYRPDDIMRLCERAARRGVRPVTTTKDYVRLPAEARAMVDMFAVRLVWKDAAAVLALLHRLR